MKLHFYNIYIQFSFYNSCIHQQAFVEPWCSFKILKCPAQSQAGYAFTKMLAYHNVSIFLSMKINLNLILPAVSFCCVFFLVCLAILIDSTPCPAQGKHQGCSVIVTCLANQHHKRLKTVSRKSMCLTRFCSLQNAL